MELHLRYNSNKMKKHLFGHLDEYKWIFSDDITNAYNIREPNISSTSLRNRASVFMRKYYELLGLDRYWTKFGCYVYVVKGAKPPKKFHPKKRPN